MWLRANKSKIGFKLPDQVYEPIMLNIKVEEEFAVQVSTYLNSIFSCPK
jgi:hypothetical protein